MSNCIICQNRCEENRSYRLVKVKEYREAVEKLDDRNNNPGQNSNYTAQVKRQLLLVGPGEEISGMVCRSCQHRLRRKSYTGIAISLALILLLLFLNLTTSGIPLVFLRIGLFLSMISGIIAGLPLLRNREILITDQFFLKARAMKEEPVIGLQDLNYFYGRTTPHWLLLLQSHWEELPSDEGDVRVMSDV